MATIDKRKELREFCKEHSKTDNSTEATQAAPAWKRECVMEDTCDILEKPRKGIVCSQMMQELGIINVTLVEIQKMIVLMQNKATCKWWESEYHKRDFPSLVHYTMGGLNRKLSIVYDDVTRLYKDTKSCDKRNDKRKFELISTLKASTHELDLGNSDED